MVHGFAIAVLLHRGVMEGILSLARRHEVSKYVSKHTLRQAKAFPLTLAPIRRIRKPLAWLDSKTSGFSRYSTNPGFRAGLQVRLAQSIRPKQHNVFVKL